MKKESLHDLAVRLCEGGIVEFEGFCLRSKTVQSGWTSCYECKMDSACSTAISDLCLECDLTDHKTHYLEFAT